MIFMAVVCVVYVVFAPALIGFFTQEPTALASGTLALRIIGCGYVMFGYGMVISQAINGAGDTYTPTVLNFVCFWLIETPLAWLLALYWGWGQVGVYSAIVIAESIMALAAMWVFQKGKWKLAKV